MIDPSTSSPVAGRRENTEKGGTKAFRLIEAIDAAQEWKKQEKGQGNPGAFLLKASPSLCYGLRARMNALTNLPSTSGRSFGESASMEAPAPFPAMSARE
jgi:hypothetical protein